MTLFKRTYFIAFAFLAACATTSNQQVSMEALPERTAPAPSVESSPETVETAKVTVDETKNEKITSEVKNPKNDAAVKVASKADRVKSWDLSGAIAAKNGKKAWSASINWMQRGQGSYQIRMFGPLGSGTVLIEKNGGVVNFRDGPKSASSTNAEQLLLKQTGVRLPVNSLFYWVRGVPAPGAVQTATRDANGNLQVLRQGGYTIQYGGYTTVGNLVLPSQIRLQGPNVFIKLVIKRWKI